MGVNRKNIKIILVDLDKTLCKESCWTDEECMNATPVKRVVDWVNNQFRENYILIWTSRQNHLMSSTFEWLDKHNIKHHGVSNRKTVADIYIDDKMMHPKDI